MTKTLKDHEQDLASKIGQISEKAGATELILLMASTFQKHLMQRTDPLNPAHASLIAMAEVIGAAVDTAEEFLKLDEAQKPEKKSRREIPGAPADTLHRVTDVEISRGSVYLTDAMRFCRDQGKHLHIVVTRRAHTEDQLPVVWADTASVISSEDAHGNTVTIFKNRFGARS